jgi:hypothetical protein
MNPNNDSDIQSPSYGLSSVRIMTLADGVFAIVLTLLVLDIKAPEAISEAQLITKLLALWLKLFSYIISFVTWEFLVRSPYGISLHSSVLTASYLAQSSIF